MNASAFSWGVSGVFAQPPGKAVASREVEPEDTSQDAGPGHWTDGIDPEDFFPGAPEFEAGAKAFAEGKDITACPHEDDHQKAADWIGGWAMARRAAE